MGDETEAKQSHIYARHSNYDLGLISVDQVLMFNTLHQKATIAEIQAKLTFVCTNMSLVVSLIIEIFGFTF